MHTLIYLSASSNLFSDEEMMDILNKSRVNNLRLGITGLLIYHEGSILQILEGEKEVIHALYKKISLDRRHKSVIKLSDKPITERSFADWSMGFKQISNNDWSELKGYLDIDNEKKFSQATNSGSPDVIRLIRSFSDVNRLSM
ncbi:MAG: BLUF domain-containing protein [Ferruginibacter sp.]